MHPLPDPGLVNWVNSVQKGGIWEVAGNAYFLTLALSIGSIQ